MGFSPLDLDNLFAGSTIDYPTAVPGMGRLGRVNDGLQGMRIVTLSNGIPGFIPPYDMRAGTPPQPSTVTFDAAAAAAEAKLAKEPDTTSDAVGRRPTKVWLSASGLELNETGLLGPTMSALRSAKSSTPAEMDAPLFTKAKQNTSLFNCWAVSVIFYPPRENGHCLCPLAIFEPDSY